MGKKELVNAIQAMAKENEVEITKKDLNVIFDCTFDTIYDSVVAGEEVKIPGLMNISTTEVPERNARNPMTGERIVVPAHKGVKVKVSPSFKKAVKQGA